MITLETMSNYYLDVFEGFNVTEDEVTNFRDDNVGLSQVAKNRISEFLLIQLTSACKHRLYNTFSITDVIQDLEWGGRGIKRRVSEFKHPPLKGLFKAHFFDEHFLMRNLINHWGLQFDNRSKFESMYLRVKEEEENNPSKHSWQGRLVHEFVIGGYEDRARQSKLTGEWIIFAKHNNQNYYLCISTHTKSHTEDHNIYNFLTLLCEHEYPFLLK